MFWLDWTIITFYLAAAVWQSAVLTGKCHRFARSGWFVLGATAVALQGWRLYQLIDVGGGHDLSIINIFALMIWLAALLIVVTALYKPVMNLSVLFFPLAAISVFLAAFFHTQSVTHSELALKQVFHIWLAVLTMSVLCIAALQAVLLAIQDYVLKSRMSTMLQWLMPLESMLLLLFQMIRIGFLLLTVLLFTSVVTLHDKFQLPFFNQTLLAFVAWFIFGLLWWGHVHWGWRGRIAIKWTLLGFALLLVSYVSTTVIFAHLKLS